MANPRRSLRPHHRSSQAQRRGAQPRANKGLLRITHTGSGLATRVTVPARTAVALTSILAVSIAAVMIVALALDRSWLIDAIVAVLRPRG